MSYSSEFNLNKKKCLSCQHYSGCHGVSGGFMGDRIEYEQKGVCDRNGTKYLQSTTATDWCSKWVCDSRISLAISKKAQRKAEFEQREIERSQREESRRQQRALENQRNEIEKERQRLDFERKRLEHERWLNSLSPEEREKYLTEQKRQAEAKKREKESQARIDQKLSRVQAKLKEIEEIRKRVKKEKRKPFIGFISLLAITLLCFGLGWIPYLSNIYNAEKNESLAHTWVLLGNSTNYGEYLEWVSLAERFRSKANEVLYIPFLILGIFLVLTIAATVLLFIQRKKKLKVLEKSFNKSKDEAFKLAEEAEKMTKQEIEKIKEKVETQVTDNKIG